mmetsp:Transcript_10523/g.15930  ORF Transcript_10523/g.15930 Transcript_10523/m.15930 type:complete len:268 (+) Transcript_10523:3925-4728(+)
MLQTLFKLLHDDLRFTICNCIFQGNIALNDIDDLMSQVIFTCSRPAAHINTWPYMQRWNRYNLHQQPFGPRPRHIQTKSFQILIPTSLEDFYSLCRWEELLPISTMGDGFHLFTIFRLHVQSNLCILWLKSIAMIALTLLPPLEKIVECLKAPFAVGDLFAFLIFKLALVHDWTGAVVTYTPQTFEHYREESLVIHRSCEINVTKVPWVGRAMDVTHTRIIGTTIYRLTINGSLIPCNARGYLAVVNGKSLRDRVLTQLIGINDTKL